MPKPAPIPGNPYPPKQAGLPFVQNVTNQGTPASPWNPEIQANRNQGSAPFK